MGGDYSGEAIIRVGVCQKSPETTLVDGLGRVSSVGRTPLVFVPAGVKINAATYKELILQPIVKDLGEMMFENQPFIFQQDGAPAHTAKSTQEWLQTNIPDFISKEEWPPSGT